MSEQTSEIHIIINIEIIIVPPHTIRQLPSPPLNGTVTARSDTTTGQWRRCAERYDYWATTGGRDDFGAATLNGAMLWGAIRLLGGYWTATGRQRPGRLLGTASERGTAVGSNTTTGRLLGGYGTPTERQLDGNGRDDFWAPPLSGAPLWGAIRRLGDYWAATGRQLDGSWTAKAGTTFGHRL